MIDPINERDLMGNDPEPATLSEWAIVLGLLTGIVLAIIFTVRALV